MDPDPTEEPGDRAGAARALDRLITESRTRGDLRRALTAMIERARLALEQDDPIRAHALASTAVALAERGGDARLAARATGLLGVVGRSQRRWAESRGYLERAIERAAEGRAPRAEAEAWVELATLHAERGDLAQTRRSLERARRCYTALGEPAELDRRAPRLLALAADRARS